MNNIYVQNKFEYNYKNGTNKIPKNTASTVFDVETDDDKTL